MAVWRYRQAVSANASALAPLNAALIREEGNRNPMNLKELTERMRYWLESEYLGAVVEDENGIAGYALYRNDSECVYLRQLYIVPAERRKNLGRELVEQVQRSNPGQRLRADTLVHNVAGIAFWRAIGFRDFYLGLEREA